MPGNAPNKNTNIIVNATEHEVDGNEVSFDQVVALAYPQPPPGQQIEYTVTYRRAEQAQHEGSMAEGSTVKVKDGTVFNVRYTDKS